MRALLLGSLLPLLLGAGAAVHALADEDAPAARPFVLVLEARPKAGLGAELLETLANVQRSAEGQPGFVEWILLEPREEDGSLTAITTWSSREAFVDFHDTDAYREVHGPEEVERIHGLVDAFAYATYDLVGGSAVPADLAGSSTGSGSVSGDPHELLHR